MQERRYGKVSVSREIIERDPDVIVESFSTLRIVVMEARPNFAVDAVDYFVCSPMLPISEFGDDVPEYDIVVSVDGTSFRPHDETLPSAGTMLGRRGFYRTEATPKEVRL